MFYLTSHYSHHITYNCHVIRWGQHIWWGNYSNVYYRNVGYDKVMVNLEDVPDMNVGDMSND